jgi:GNAT superfamily N-acetyltransferase
MSDPDYLVRETREEDFAAITRLTRTTYPTMPPWEAEQLRSHRMVFPEGQHVAVDARTGEVVGMTASLIIAADDYPLHAGYGDYTGGGLFTNHDPVRGRTLYGAEVMVDPRTQGKGIGKKLYKARRQLVRRLGLRRIRAGARLRGYSRYADRLTPEAYVAAVVEGRIADPTLTFQLSRGFVVIGVARGYLRDDPPSRGHAAVIEWMAAKPEVRAQRRKVRVPARPHAVAARVAL